MENYNKLLKKAKEAYKNCATDAEKRRLESIFPELKENDNKDERIRKAMGKTYIIEFKRREQYDCACNCEAKSIAKTFDENTTLSEVAEWVKEQAGSWFDEYNILTNPQILGIVKE